MIARIRTCRWHALRGFCTLPHVGPFHQARIGAGLMALATLALLVASPFLEPTTTRALAFSLFGALLPIGLLWLAADAVDRSVRSDARVVQERFDLLLCAYVDAHGWADDGFIWEIRPPYRGRPLQAEHVVPEGKRRMDTSPGLLDALHRALFVEGRPLRVEKGLRTDYASMVIGRTLSSHARLAACAAFEDLARRIGGEVRDTEWPSDPRSPYYGTLLSLRF